MSKGKKYCIVIMMCYIVYCIVDFSIHTTSAKEITEGIAKKIIRLHVLANSDAPEDQALKLKVKDAIVVAYEEVFAGAKDKKEAEELINKNKEAIRKTALQVIREEGYTYDVTVSLTNCMFPTKVYKDLTFPAGYYDALRIQIGEADGKNWWCVMYPPLCFVDQTYSIVPDDSKEQLKELLEPKEYGSLFADSSTEVTYRFKIVEVIQDIFHINE
ncbi:stage II sporulation protein R [Anaerosporobacter faecicola]|uniref:stage II sporulation protein R n=1 Tax=Anaerosporobacter faecicola TaxID=2718714 RepID=UPI00143AD497|nr:stage II sporulation protein R [Anaerosporobacter faecicola]